MGYITIGYIEVDDMNSVYLNPNHNLNDNANPNPNHNHKPNPNSNPNPYWRLPI